MASKKMAGARPRRSAQAKNTGSRLTISIVGAGRLGTALGLALATRGYEIEAVVARRKSHARRASQLIPSCPRALSSMELDQLPASRLLLVTTPDDAINATAAQIASTVAAKNSLRVALHASGALSSTELSSLRERGWSTGSMHPLIAVSDALSGAEGLRRAFFCIEGDERAVRVAKDIVRSLGARSFSIKAADKALYHAAAVVASGHMVALFDIATEMLTRCRLSEKEARLVLLPLVQSTIENLSEQSPARALTGTFARADVSTARRHLAAIRRAGLRDALAVYTLLARRSLLLAKKRGANAKSIEEIIKELVAYSEDHR